MRPKRPAASVLAFGACLCAAVGLLGRCGSFPVSKKWEGPPVACNAAFDLDEECTECVSMSCDTEMATAYGDSWAMNRRFDGTGRCIGTLSCHCMYCDYQNTSGACLDCYKYHTDDCLDALKSARRCAVSACGDNCEPR